MIPFSDEELINPVKNTLNTMRPMLRQDGGDLEFLGVKEGVVYVRLVGHCHGCPSSDQTLKYGLERQLKLDIHPELTLVNVPHGQEIEF